MPPWDQLPTQIRTAWEAAVRQAGDCLDLERGGTLPDPQRWAGWTPPPENDDALDLPPITDEQLQTILLLVGVELPLVVLQTWTVEQREQVEEWAIATHLSASDHDDIPVPERPGWLVHGWDTEYRAPRIPTPSRSTQAGTLLVFPTRALTPGHGGADNER
jgi:hypothetical protein